MIKNVIVLSCLAGASVALAADDPAKPATAKAIGLESEAKKVSYIFGSNIGARMKADGIEIDSDALLAGLKDSMSGAKSRLNDEDMQTTMQKFQEKMQAAQQKAAGEAGAENEKKGADFLAANAKKEGVKTTASGLQYEIIKAGTGPKPAATDTVKVHYHGTLLDGTVFDSSVEKKAPATFPVSQVIPGWVEGLQLMPVGSKWKFFIPSKLAYAEKGAGGDIGPNSTLIFEVELLGIEKAPK